jgi:hypothetical protein
MIQHTLTLKSGKQIYLSNDEAREVHEQLEQIFGPYLQKFIPTPYTPFQPPSWPGLPYEVWCRSSVPQTAQ